MALFPRGPLGSFDTKDRAFQQKMEEVYQNNISSNQILWAEADIDARFEAGDQNVFQEVYGMEPGKQNFVFNHLRRITNLTSGFQRRNRKSTIVIPVENADSQTADQFTKVFSWCDRQENILHSVSDAFHGALVTGMNLLHVWVDYRNDPKSGDIKVDNCSYNSFLMDPFFRKKDLSDCNNIWKRSYLDQRTVISLLPKYKKQIKEMTGTSYQDGKFEYMPENFLLENKNLLSYDEYYYRTFRKQKMLIDSNSGEVLEWSGQDDDKLKQFLVKFPTITVVEQEVPTVNLAIVVQGKVLYDGKNPNGTDLYPFVPVFGYFNPDLPDFSRRIQGMVRGLRDPQYVYNRLKTTELAISESKMTTGWIAKEGAVIDQEELYKTGEGGTIMLKHTAQMTDIMPIPSQEIPQSFFQLSQSIATEIMTISGANEELLGSATDDKAGVLSMLRQGAGLTTLQGLFDQLDMSQKLLGQLMIDMIQSNFTPGKIKRIIEDEPTQQFYNKAFGRYDAAVEEGLNTTTQRQMQFAQLLQLKEAGVPVPDSVLIEAATVQDKKKLTDAIEQSNQQAQEMEQFQLQAAIKEQEARTNLAEARAQADLGLHAERVSRIPENRALAIERLAEANKDREVATLNKVKAMKELDEMDLSQIQKLLLMAQQLKEAEKAEEVALASQAVQPQETEI